MKHIISKSTVIAALSCTILIGSEAFGFGNPCENIAKSCQEEGYSKSAAVGKRLVKDCVLPVVRGNKTVSYAATADEKRECEAMVLKKMGSQ